VSRAPKGALRSGRARPGRILGYPSGSGRVLRSAATSRTCSLPSLQVGGYLPNVLHAGGVASLSLRGSSAEGWDPEAYLRIQYVQSITPANLYGADIRAAYFTVSPNFCVRRHPLGFCLGFGMPAGGMFNRTPSGDRIFDRGSVGYVSAAELGVDTIVKIGGGFSVRAYAMVQVAFERMKIQVNERPDQEWRSIPVYGTLSVELLVDIWNHGRTSKEDPE
jgi:hypothetical protein